MTEPIQLNLAGIYERKVEASLDRIWENVFDWEHLSHLHDTTFSHCNLLESGEWGWRVELAMAGQEAADAQIIELKADRESGHYYSVSKNGVGAGTEIRVWLSPDEDFITDVQVEFHVPESDAQQLAMIGAGYSSVYARLWDEDEVMMQERERMLSLRISGKNSNPKLKSIVIGSEKLVRQELPKSFLMNGHEFQLIESGGNLISHSTLCPHWLGPLNGKPNESDELVCPWHGYAFDVRTGACIQKPSLKLRKPPTIDINGGQIVAIWPL